MASKASASTDELRMIVEFYQLIVQNAPCEDGVDASLSPNDPKVFAKLSNLKVLAYEPLAQ